MAFWLRRGLGALRPAGLFGLINFLRRNNDPWRVHRDRPVDDDPRVDAFPGPAMMDNRPPRRMHDQVMRDRRHQEVSCQLGPICRSSLSLATAPPRPPPGSALRRHRQSSPHRHSPMRPVRSRCRRFPPSRHTAVPDKEKRRRRRRVSERCRPRPWRSVSGWLISFSDDSQYYHRQVHCVILDRHAAQPRRYPPPTRRRSPPTPSIALRSPDNSATIDGAARGERPAAARSGV